MKRNKKKHTLKAAQGERAIKTHPGHNDSAPLKLLTPELLLIGIFIVALSIRLLYLKQMLPTPLFHGLVADAEKFDSLALKILRGDFTHQEFIYLNPLYPFFLTLIYRIGGYSHLPVFVIQAALDSLGCLLLYYIASTYFNKIVGILAAITYACYGLTIFYTGTILAPTLIIFLTLSFTAALVAAQERRKLSLFFIAGILFGLMASARPNVVVFLVFLPLWFLTVLKKRMGLHKTIQGFLLLGIGLSIVLSLVAIRNYSITKNFSPFSVQGGINFYIGNNPEATGTFMSPHGISSSPIAQVKTSISYAENESGQQLTPAQASRYWFLQGLRFIKNNPLDALSLSMTKASLFWRKEELPLNVDYALSSTLVPLLRLPLISFGIIAPLALLGIILSFTRKTGMPLVILFIASHLLSVTIFFVTARYRVLAVPFLIICSSYALYGGGIMIRARDKKNIVIFGAVLALLFTGINKDFSFFALTDPAKHYSNLGLVLTRQGKADEAFSALQKALALDPYCLEAHYNLGNVYRKKGQLTEAIEAYKKALQINSGFAEAHNNLGIAYGEQGLLDEAILQFNRALKANPSLVDAYFNRGTAYGKKGALDEAVSDLKKALTLYPEHAGAQFNLGMAYHSKGMRNEAITQFRKAIALDPNLKAAYKQLGLEE